MDGEAALADTGVAADQGDRSRRPLSGRHAGDDGALVLLPADEVRQAGWQLSGADRGGPAVRLSQGRAALRLCWFPHGRAAVEDGCLQLAQLRARLDRQFGQEQLAEPGVPLERL